MSSILVMMIGIGSCVTDPIMPDLTRLNPDEPCPQGIIHFKREIQPIISSNCAFSETVMMLIQLRRMLVLDTYEKRLFDTFKIL